jgi:hypothetical protein
MSIGNITNNALEEDTIEVRNDVIVKHNESINSISTPDKNIKNQSKLSNDSMKYSNSSGK